MVCQTGSPISGNMDKNGTRQDITGGRKALKRQCVVVLSHVTRHVKGGQKLVTTNSLAVLNCLFPKRRYCLEDSNEAIGALLPGQAWVMQHCCLSFPSGRHESGMHGNFYSSQSTLNCCRIPFQVQSKPKHFRSYTSSCSSS